MAALPGRRRYVLRAALPSSSGQPLEHIHHRSGIARPSTIGKQLQGAPAVLHGVVPSNPASVLQTKDCVQAHPRVQDPIRGLRVPRRHTKAFIEAGKEVRRARGWASSMVVAPASLSSVTSLSWSVPAVRFHAALWLVEIVRISAARQAHPLPGRTGWERRRSPTVACA